MPGKKMRIGGRRKKSNTEEEKAEKRQKYHSKKKQQPATDVEMPPEKRRDDPVTELDERNQSPEEYDPLLQLRRGRFRQETTGKLAESLYLKGCVSCRAFDNDTFGWSQNAAQLSCLDNKGQAAIAVIDGTAKKQPDTNHIDLLRIKKAATIDSQEKEVKKTELVGALGVIKEPQTLKCCAETPRISTPRLPHGCAMGESLGVAGFARAHKSSPKNGDCYPKDFFSVKNADLTRANMVQLFQKTAVVITERLDDERIALINEHLAYEGICNRRCERVKREREQLIKAEKKRKASEEKRMKKRRKPNPPRAARTFGDLSGMPILEVAVPAQEVVRTRCKQTKNRPPDLPATTTRQAAPEVLPPMIQLPNGIKADPDAEVAPTARSVPFVMIPAGNLPSSCAERAVGNARLHPDAPEPPPTNVAAVPHTQIDAPPPTTTDTPAAKTNVPFLLPINVAPVRLPVNGVSVPSATFDASHSLPQDVIRVDVPATLPENVASVRPLETGAPIPTTTFDAPIAPPRSVIATAPPVSIVSVPPQTTDAPVPTTNAILSPTKSDTPVERRYPMIRVRDPASLGIVSNRFGEENTISLQKKSNDLVPSNCGDNRTLCEVKRVSSDVKKVSSEVNKVPSEFKGFPMEVNRISRSSALSDLNKKLTEDKGASNEEATVREKAQYVSQLTANSVLAGDGIALNIKDISNIAGFIGKVWVELLRLTVGFDALRSSADGSVDEDAFRTKCYQLNQYLAAKRPVFLRAMRALAARLTLERALRLVAEKVRELRWSQTGNSGGFTNSHFELIYNLITSEHQQHLNSYFKLDRPPLAAQPPSPLAPSSLSKENLNKGPVSISTVHSLQNGHTPASNGYHRYMQKTSDVTPSVGYQSTTTASNFDKHQFFTTATANGVPPNVIPVSTTCNADVLQRRPVTTDIGYHPRATSISTGRSNVSNVDTTASTTTSGYPVNTAIGNPVYHRNRAASIIEGAVTTLVTGNGFPVAAASLNGRHATPLHFTYHNGIHPSDSTTNSGLHSRAAAPNNGFPTNSTSSINGYHPTATATNNSIYPLATAMNNRPPTNVFHPNAVANSNGLYQIATAANNGLPINTTSSSNGFHHKVVTSNGFLPTTSSYGLAINTTLNSKELPTINSKTNNELHANAAHSSNGYQAITGHNSSTTSTTTARSTLLGQTTNQQQAIAPHCQYPHGSEASTVLQQNNTPTVPTLAAHNPQRPPVIHPGSNGHLANNINNAPALAGHPPPNAAAPGIASTQPDLVRTSTIPNGLVPAVRKRKVKDANELQQRIDELSRQKAAAKLASTHVVLGPQGASIVALAAKRKYAHKGSRGITAAWMRPGLPAASGEKVVVTLDDAVENAFGGGVVSGTAAPGKGDQSSTEGGAALNAAVSPGQVRASVIRDTKELEVSQPVATDATEKCVQCSGVSVGLCGACKAVAYCSEDCMTQHWINEHSKVCERPY